MKYYKHHLDQDLDINIVDLQKAKLDDQVLYDKDTGQYYKNI